MEVTTLAERTVDILLDARRKPKASDEPRSAADELDIEPGEFVKQAVGLGMFMQPFTDPYEGPSKITDGSRAWKKVIDYEGCGQVRITVYKKPHYEWYMHLLYDPYAMWHHERPHQHLYFGAGQPKYYSPEQVEERVIRCVQWLIKELDKKFDQVQNIDYNDPRVANDPNAKTKFGVTVADNAFHKVAVALQHGSYMPDEPPPSNTVTVPPQTEARKPRAAVPPPPSQDEIDFSPDEMKDMFYTSQQYGPIMRLSAVSQNYDNVDLSGSVTRTSSRYAHENTIQFEWDYRVDSSEWVDKETGDNPPENVYEPLNKLINDVQDMLTEHARSISQTIYRQLEKEYEYQTTGEGAIESIKANEYTFDEDGNRSDDEGSLQYEQLDNRAQERAREWYAEGNPLDYEWWDSEYDWWKERLVEMGWSDRKDNIEIQFSGFYSQGDGASFSCSNFDFQKYVTYLAQGKAKDLSL